MNELSTQNITQISGFLFVNFYVNFLLTKGAGVWYNKNSAQAQDKARATGPPIISWLDYSVKPFLA